MPRHPYAQVLIDAEKIKNTWMNHPTFAVGDVNRAAFLQALDRAVELDASVESVRNQMVGLATERDDATDYLWDLVTRARSGFRANFGPDSKEYEQAGGTRRSERRSPRRKAAGTASN